VARPPEGVPWDVFISYAQRDDHPPPAPGWISVLKTRLEERLSTVMPRDCYVWFDQTGLRHSERLDQIFEYVDGSTCFLSVVSPRHATSPWCSDEYARFTGRGATAQGCMFRIDKLPLAERGFARTMPESLRELKAAPFYAGDPPSELLPDDYATLLNRLVFEMKAALLRRSEQTDSVFLWAGPGDDTDDTAANAERIWRELLRDGAAVRAFPRVDGQTARDADVTESLEVARLAIVVLGAHHDAESWQRLEQVLEARNATMVLLPNADDADAQQTALITALRANPRGAEIHESGTGRFIKAVRDNLAFARRETTAGRVIALLSDVADAAEAERIADELPLGVTLNPIDRGRGTEYAACGLAVASMTIVVAGSLDETPAQRLMNFANKYCPTDRSRVFMSRAASAPPPASPPTGWTVVHTLEELAAAVRNGLRGRR
jgi:hypothetical protein